MKEECLICKAPLEYIQDVLMECSICHKSEFSKTRCVNGHYVCNECHSKGVDSIVGLCLNETSCDPIEIIGKMMDMPFCHMHGPEHHIMPSKEEDVNDRNDSYTEIVGTNGVHPSIKGYYQIGDAFYRALHRVLPDVKKD